MTQSFCGILGRVQAIGTIRGFSIHEETLLGTGTTEKVSNFQQKQKGQMCIDHKNNIM